MKKYWLLLSSVIIASVVGQQVQARMFQPSIAAAQTDTANRQNRIVGQVTALDAATGQITVKTDSGNQVSILMDEGAAYLRIAPGETSLNNAEKITLADVKVGDRILVRGTAGEAGKPVHTHQLIVMSRASIAREQDRDREEMRRRNIAGRITALNPSTKEITLMARSREGAEPVKVTFTDNTRFIRYAPDSLKLSDAVPASLAELKVGDQIRARGQRSADEKSFAAEEIIAGSITRTGGTITAINTANNEVTIKEAQTGKTLTLVIGQRTSLRRITPEAAALMPQRRPGGEAPNAPRNARAGQDNRSAGPENGRPGGVGPGGGGRNFQQIFESLPALTIADLKTGDAVLAVSTNSADQSRVTVATLLTGDAEFINRMLQGQPRGPRNTSPGLPGDVIGGGINPREQP